MAAPLTGSVGKRQVQLSRFDLSHRCYPLRSIPFPGLPPYYEGIRPLHPHRVRVVAFLNPTLPGRMEVSWNKTEQSPAALSSLPARLDRISGIAFQGTLTQADLPVDASLSVQSCGSLPTSFPRPLAVPQLPSGRGCLR